mmetsp:Transcript_19680/g.51037  ORF Transcript_19680/g.51037 Transcript_19680/m.51037 type:complete len:267 (+) Transcript_19680:105-905(+)|eukprot:CAMPEP_0202389292 /NCGR_PEP_ID=MMETSP1127-20130417/82029_1 /ASSEMBLY_ACC=CAM_ASM_000462 /TAXON_ID=3047 /ORGANISM="Dunaliella tertiolecta, Strain CCMP1320" /LENGTH=266 /DNA_ID=CAMNT_0048990983 /DNA_START=75 /DNA_END=875 /DNA_ORIENTATION=-
MSNCETFELPPVEVQSHQVREVLRCLLNTIIFGRALGYVRPKDVDSELLDTSYVAVSDPDVDALLEQRIGEFSSAVEKHPPSDMVQVRLSFYERRQRQAWFAAKFSDERRDWEQWCINLIISKPQSQVLQRVNEPASTHAHPQPLSEPLHLTQLDAQTSAGPKASPGNTNCSSNKNTAGAANSSNTSPSSAAAASPVSRLAATLEAARMTITRCVSDKRDHIPPVVSASTITFPFDITSSTGGRSPFSLSSVKQMLLHTSPPPMLQ